MKFKTFLSAVFILGLAYFSVAQTDEATKEKIAALGNVDKGTLLSGYIPVVNWPIIVENDDEMFTFSFPVMTSFGDNRNISSTALRNNTVVVHNDNGTCTLTITADFYPAAEREMAGFFYSIGIEQVMLQGKLISVLDYINEFRALVSKEIKKNRTYISQK